AMLELKCAKKVKNIIVDIGVGNINVDDILIRDFIVCNKVIGHDLGIELQVVWKLIFIEQRSGNQPEHIVFMYDHHLGKVVSCPTAKIQFGLEFLQHQVWRGLRFEVDLFKSQYFVGNGVGDTKRKSIQA